MLVSFHVLVSPYHSCCGLLIYVLLRSFFCIRRPMLRWIFYGVGNNPWLLVFFIFIFMVLLERCQCIACRCRCSQNNAAFAVVFLFYFSLFVFLKTFFFFFGATHSSIVLLICYIYLSIIALVKTTNRVSSRAHVSYIPRSCAVLCCDIYGSLTSREGVCLNSHS